MTQKKTKPRVKGRLKMLKQRLKILKAKGKLVNQDQDWERELDIKAKGEEDE